MKIIGIVWEENCLFFYPKITSNSFYFTLIFMKMVFFAGENDLRNSPHNT